MLSLGLLNGLWFQEILKDVHLDVWISHTARHTSDQQRDEIDAAVDESGKDKNGVSVSYKDGVDFGIIDPAEALRKDVLRTADVVISRAEDAVPVGLYSYCLSSSPRGDNYGTKFSATLLGNGKVIRPEAPRIVSVTFHPSFGGRYEDTLELTFRDLSNKQQFVITRRIYAIVGSQEDYDRLKPKSAFVKPKPAIYEQPKRIIRVFRPPTWSYTKWVVELPEFKAPQDLIDAAFGPRRRTSVNPYMPKFSVLSYGRFFQVLLWIEEEQMRRNLEIYAMKDVKLDLAPANNGFSLNVAGLSEGRPSVIVGDLILVRHVGDATGTWYEGCVHGITGISVLIRCNDKFRALRGTMVDVKFVLNRLPDRRMHQAVVAPFNPPRLLLPDNRHLTNGVHLPRALEVASISLVDRSLAQNSEQMQTIVAIANRPPGSVPFIVFGPPGTGKTVTIVEAIRQLIIRDPKATILACAPTNSAADLIASRLVSNLNRNELFRLNSYARPFKALMLSLRDYSLYNDNDVFAIPPLASLLKYERLPNKKFPLIFHGIVGKDTREASSPSFFNVDEVTVVKDYALSLLEDRKLRVTTLDIGIIAPYHAQCVKILTALGPKLKGIKVGSVEEFQGQERRIIIISTVRSSSDFITYDMKRTLGFVANPRRFNVAITRAQALLIVVGNPLTLGLDPMWRSWLNYVHQKGGWRGKELNWDPLEPLESEGYDRRTRDKAQAEAAEMMQRIRSHVLENLEPWAFGDDDTIEANGESNAREFQGREAD
ncbi:hypothetical protein EW026_g7015 [Hermanssonia centrifuga]|uniref:RNA helicase n=1 Tax=Hermanssonia centrifuga TaxID=98765 RepID=A0A4S4K969_9APHY|nr:hypothetical protein EW026_g7015 [Hermanssonia centrifuga]